MPRPASRSASSRAASARPTVQAYQPNQVLSSPQLRGSGKHFRWVREKVLGAADELSVNSAIVSGFRPVRIADLADTCSYRMLAELMSADGSENGVVRYGGLIGMVYDEELNDQRRAAAQREIDQNTSSAQAIFGIEAEVRGGLPVVHEDRGTHTRTGAAVDPSMGAP